ncbi:Ldh family oxidoreductase [Azotobacter beijerinckii]|uniref:Ldh family oxidoreductase n=1 Tax=Azotobacter beijerinckii TaxID=170623 RepID=UPI002954EDA5|nr:Ldh family oxidoreductase [Azotobacter beijerinckii]MDV7213241.1 Ldh family oxidoreductase [Azotobacter beijerinckii]
MTSDSTVFSYEALLQSVTGIFGAYLPPDDARYVSRCLVEADARGIASHGIGRIPVYTKRLREGLVNPHPGLQVTGTDGATAHLDGDNGMGYVVARKAMAVAIELGQRYGIGMVLASHSNHFGMAATYLQQALDANLGALVLTNAPPLMPVWGARAPFLGTSPFAFAAPGRVPLMLDMATSVVAFGKIRRAARMGEAIPGDWALDAQGVPTTDPTAALEGVVLPMGGPKGSGLGMMMELFAGVMSGSAFGGEVRNQNSDFTRAQNVGHTFITFRPDSALPMTDYLQRADELVRRAKALPLAEGFEQIHMPGERESAALMQAKARGLPVSAQDLQMLEAEKELSRSVAVNA